MSSWADLRIGNELAGYRIETLVGRGGMGLGFDITVMSGE
jgi:hypothetical protein